jgi:hypothetical protein
MLGIPNETREKTLILQPTSHLSCHNQENGFSLEGYKYIQGNSNILQLKGMDSDFLRWGPARHRQRHVRIHLYSGLTRFGCRTTQSNSKVSVEQTVMFKR